MIFSLRYGDFTIFKMADLRHLEFYGSNKWFFEKLMYWRTSYRSSTETIALNCLCILATDDRTDVQMDSPDALRRSRCRQRRLNKLGLDVT